MTWLDKVFVQTSTTPYRPDPAVLRSLYLFDDGRTRLRWSDREEKWCLERKVAAGIDYIKALRHWVKRKDGAIVENDSWIRARDGCILVRLVDPLPRLGRWLIQELQWGDPWRFNGPKEIALMLERQEEKRLEAIERKHTEQNESLAKDWLDSEIWRQGERAAVPKQYEGIAHV